MARVDRNALLQTIRTALRRVAEPENAGAMQAYMKSAMPFLGVSSKPRRAVCRELFAPLAWADARAWERDVLSVWRGARWREERYAAIELTGVKRARAFQTPSTMPMYEELITSGAWWDYVDDIAVHRVGPLLLSHPREMKKLLRAWSRSPDMWKARTSIIAQVLAHAETDAELLYACIEPSLGSREFFLRKAIGWALRSYAWTNPREIKRYTRAHAKELSPLSMREALKNIDP